MIKISLVGDIGSGKTFVSKLFRVTCFFADVEVKRLYRSNRQCFIKLKKKFPQFIKTFPISTSLLYIVSFSYSFPSTICIGNNLFESLFFNLILAVFS